MTATSFKGDETVGYLVHFVLLSFTTQSCKFLIDHGHTGVALLPVATSDTRTDVEHAFAARN